MYLAISAVYPTENFISSICPNDAFDFLRESTNIKKLPKNPKTANNIIDVMEGGVPRNMII